MSEYTPTTEEVEDSYQWGVNACGCCATRDEADIEAFQRWLAEVRRQAAEEALLQAADEIFVQHAEFDPGKRIAFHRGADAVYDALRARAAEIREGKNDE